jgi:hypothetical protein
MPTNTNKRRHNGRHKGGQQTATQQSESREGNTLGEMRQQASRYLEQGNEQFREMTRDHEGTAVLVALAAGFGVGVLIGCAMAPSPRRHSWTDRIAAEGLGRKIMQRFEGMIPEMIGERLHR